MRKPLMSPVKLSEKRSTGWLIDVESFASKPEIASNK